MVSHWGLPQRMLRTQRLRARLARAPVLRHTYAMAGFGLKGSAALVVALVAIAALAIYARSFVLIIIAGAVAAIVILHFWNKRPVKTPEDDQIRLNLDK